LAQALYQINAQKMQIDDSRLSRRIALDAIDAEIAAAELKLARLKPLAEDGFATRADVEDLETRLMHDKRQREADQEALDLAAGTRAEQNRQIEQALSLIRRNLDESRRNLEDLIIRSPISGQLTALDAEIGAYKSAGGRVGQIDRTDAYKLVCLVDEFYLGRLAVGQVGTARIDNQEIQLRVARIHPEVKDRQFTVDLDFAGSAPPSVRRGQTVRVRLEIGEAGESLIVANGPFYDDAGGQWAFVLSPSGGTALRRPVSRGRRTIDSVEVLSGLSAGEKIVTSSYADFEKIDTIDIRTAGGGNPR
jgi:HlyD family secretion protein